MQMDSVKKKKIKTNYKSTTLGYQKYATNFCQLTLTASLNINTHLGTMSITLKTKMSHWIVRATSKPEKYFSNEEFLF